MAADGPCIELGQAFTTHRTVALRDVLIDTLGGITSTAWYLLERRPRRADVLAWVRARATDRDG